MWFLNTFGLTGFCSWAENVLACITANVSIGNSFHKSWRHSDVIFAFLDCIHTQRSETRRALKPEDFTSSWRLGKVSLRKWNSSWDFQVALAWRRQKDVKRMSQHMKRPCEHSFEFPTWCHHRSPGQQTRGVMVWARDKAQQVSNPQSPLKPVGNCLQQQDSE